MASQGRAKRPSDVAAQVKTTRAEKERAYQADLRATLTGVTNDIERLAKTHRRPIKSVEQGVHVGGVLLRQQRKPNLWNAALSVASDLLGGTAARELGHQTDMEEMARELIDEYKSEDCSSETKDLIDSRLSTLAAAKTTPKVTPRAVQSDANHTLAHIDKAFEGLHARDSVEYVVFFSKGNLNDSIQPGYLASEKGEEFANRILGAAPSTIAQKLEAYSVIGQPGTKRKDKQNKGANKGGARDVIRDQLRP
ncbi:hypothetical protein BOTBODRAFT_175464 [Botryobasidium botryosum FD-172 SS1]|uniref:Uncharacterized protein n=1 Tax=Botryobasidium botryosum (strain FD-172 SS1) TaxID=930990 RepID=A0A067MFI1_BOTB1|nr:hypothetical protein BOTBODRAFT_175464 [Botryobasidium botryosum FD-172 SS1]